MSSHRTAIRESRRALARWVGQGTTAVALGILVLAAAPSTPTDPATSQSSQPRRAVAQDAVSSSESQDLLRRMQAIFDAAEVPRELAWLAEIESSFDPTARSRAGAVGLYQLMPLTAKSLGLSLEPNDERLIPEANARAAAKYLRYLYRRFGDWALVLAAYNAGETRVNRLLTETESNSFEMIAPLLPAETRAYVPKMDAVLQLRAQCNLRDLPPPGVRLVSSR
jgi:hypothetical protein